MPTPFGRWTFNARLSRVVDGDTALLELDCGFAITISQRVRLADINCPEVIGPTHADGVAASVAAGEWFAGALKRANDPRWPLIVATKKTDDYGRYIAKVWATGDPEGQSLNEYLVANGFAVPFDVGKGGV